MTTIQTKVAAIHSDFRNALNASSFKVDDIPKNEEEIKTLNRLERLNLTSSETFKKLSKKVGIYDKERKENEFIKEVRAIETRYPEYRLIGLKKVFELCEKYNLYVGMIYDYIGTIPNKNILEYEKHIKTVVRGQQLRNINELFTENDCCYDTNSYIIAAPRKDFDSNLTEIGHSLQYINKPKFSLQFNMEMPNLMPDPIIMFPLKIDGVCLLQIVTAWGDEAEDDSVSNEIKTESNNN